MLLLMKKRAESRQSTPPKEPSPFRAEIKTRSVRKSQPHSTPRFQKSIDLTPGSPRPSPKSKKVESDYESDTDSGIVPNDEEYEEDDPRGAMLDETFKKYQPTPSPKGRRQRSQAHLSLQKVESKKKLTSVWEAIIQKYSAYGEDDQGDIVNLKDMSIEHDTGHIKTLQIGDRTKLWDGILDDSTNTNGDPLNLLAPAHSVKNTPTRISAKTGLVTPITSTRKNSEKNYKRSHVMDRPPPKWTIPTNARVISLSSDSENEEDEKKEEDENENTTENENRATNTEPSKRRTSSSPSKEDTPKIIDKKSVKDDIMSSNFKKLSDLNILKDDFSSPSIDKAMRITNDDPLNMLTPTHSTRPKSRSQGTPTPKRRSSPPENQDDPLNLLVSTPKKMRYVPK